MGKTGSDMGDIPSTELNARLVSIIEATPWFMRALRVVRDMALPNWCIGAGALRNVVWDSLHGYAAFSLPRDIDLALFDTTDLSREHDREIELRLRRVEPAFPWEVTNQAGVHLWFEQVFGHTVEPLLSIEDAVASWPETATAVAVCLDEKDVIRVIAPLGLEDLFGMVVRRNPRRVGVETYRRRIASKRYPERWPMVRVIEA